MSELAASAAPQAVFAPEAVLKFRAAMDESPAALGWSACGRWLAAISATGMIHILDASSLEISSWQAHQPGGLALAWHPSKQLLASSGQDGYVRLWDFSTGGTLKACNPKACNPKAYAPKACAEVALADDSASTWIEQISWRPDGAQLAIAAGTKIVLLSPEGDLAAAYVFPGGTVAALCWRPKGAQLAAAGYGGIRIYNVLDSSSRPQDLKWKGSLLSISWSPDGRVIAAGCQDNTVHFWRLPELRDAMMSGFQYKPVQLSWSNNSRWLITGGSSSLILWPFDKKGPEGRKPVSLQFHQEAICAVSISSRGHQLATGCRGGQIALWTRIGDPLPAFEAQLDSRPEFLAWSPQKNARLLASVSRNGTLNLWEAL